MNFIHPPQIGQYVRRLASDYTAGRVGRVVEVDPARGRARVFWEVDARGEKLPSMRTWVRFRFLSSGVKPQAKSPVVPNTRTKLYVARHDPRNSNVVQFLFGNVGALSQWTDNADLAIECHSFRDARQLIGELLIQDAVAAFVADVTGAYVPR